MFPKGYLMNYLIKEVNNNVGIITLNHPNKVNPLSKGLINELCLLLPELVDDKVRVIIIRASKGAKVFSAGHDINELSVDGRDPLTYDDPLRRVIRAIENCPIPIIAMIEGSVWGGACELVSSCDIVLASKETTFAITPAKMGMAYNLSGILRFMKPGGLHLIKEMAFTAKPFPSEKLAQNGIINYAVEIEKLEEKTFDIAKEITKYSPLVLRILKEEMRVLSNSYPLNPEAFERIQSLRQEVYMSEDYKEAISAFKEKRPPVFKGK